MNFDRFGFKAIGKSTGDWSFARMAASGFGCFGIRWSDSIHEDYDGCHIYPETICQCTGLKDSNGKLIYENDIIHRLDEVNKRNYLIQYNPGSFHFQVKGEGETEWYDFSFIKLWMDHGVKCVVVGNKFDKEEEPHA